jgi:hypothetical protein
MSRHAAPSSTSVAHATKVTGTYLALAGLVVFFGLIVFGAGGHMTGHWAAAMQTGAGVLVLVGVVAAVAGLAVEHGRRR